jgi:hypothetical protein
MKASNLTLPLGASALAQLALVLAAHSSNRILQLIPILGSLIALLAGAWYGMRATAASRGAIAGGAAIVGGLGALISIIVSVALHDSTISALFIGSLFSAFTATIGGIATSLTRRSARRLA